MKLSGRLSAAVNFPLWVLLITDAFVVASAFYLSALIRYRFELEQVALYVGPLLPRATSFSFWVIVGMVSVGMYRARQRPHFGDMLARVVVAICLGFLADILFFYLFPSLMTGRGILIGAAFIACLVLPLTRLYLLKFFDISPVRRRVLVLGAGQTASRIGVLRRKSDKRRFEIVGFVPAGPAEWEYAERSNFSPLYETLEEAVDELSIDEIVIALDERRGAFPAQILLEQKFHGIQVTDIIDFLEQELEKIDLSVMYPGWFIFETSRHSSPLHSSLKRFFDLFNSCFLLALMSPVFLCVVVGIIIEDGLRAPILYRQKRVGRNHQNFDLLKFRSMVVDAESETGARWASGSDDDRVTRIGRIIRRFRIDELPQVLNVLMGDMSIVGPRPERPEFVEKLSAAVPMYDYRHCVRPGITGWAQLNFPYGSSVLDAREKLKFDLYYIKNADIIFDVFILLQTLEVVLWGKATSMSGPNTDDPDSDTEKDVRLFEKK
jgi:sugar transferase (PEP-CTERM system associated)